ncbi:MAG: acyl-CoA dehydrogenase family protein [Rhodothermales bacterium]
MQFSDVSAPHTFEKSLLAIQQFVDEEIIPLEKSWQKGRFNYLLPILQQKREQVKSRGWWTPQIAHAFGGLGLRLPAYARISEILGKTPFGHYIFNCQAPDAGNMEILISHGTPEQKQHFLKPLLRGSTRSCFAMTEPAQAGSNPVILTTTATKVGEEYIINGHKWFTTGADGAGFAIVMAITNPLAENPYERASQIIVPTNTPGFKRIRNISVMGDEGEDWMSHSEIRFDNVRVPRSFLLGKEGEGFKIAQERLGPGRIHHCMRWLGICERAFDMMCRRALSRELKAGVTLANKQSIQNFIAESRVEINAARLMVLDAANKIEVEGAYAARIDISLIKFYVAGVLQKVLDRAIQVHGALGMSDDTLLSFWYRHERASRIYDGADEVHKSRAARLILKNYTTADSRSSDTAETGIPARDTPLTASPGNSKTRSLTENSGTS